VVQPVQPDLVIDSIVLPPWVTAPCSTKIQVVVRNAGLAPAPYPFEVCLQIAAFVEEPFVPEWFERVGIPWEGPSALAPGQTASVQFDLGFPCRPQAWVIAEVDCKGQVTGNLRSDPRKAVFTLVRLVPWLATEVEIGRQDSAGVITWDVSPLCPNLPMAVRVTATNRGCADAAASTTRLTVGGPSGQIAQVDWPTGKLPAKQTVRFSYLVKLPTPPPANVTVEACADIGGVVAGQCDTASLCRSVSPQISTMGTGAPGPFLVDVVVRPGETPTTTWSLRNDCSDLGQVLAEILVGSHQLATSARQVAPLEKVTEQIILKVSPAAASSVWTVGQHFMELRITATGLPGKTFVHTANLVCNLELPRFSFVWDKPASPTFRKVYSVAGTLTNTSFLSAMMPSAITITEATTTAGVTAAGAFSVAPPAEILPTKTAAFKIPDRSQIWTWINPTTFQLAGPTVATFTYSVTFTLTDEFGNVYPAVSPTSMPVLTVNVAVPANKLALQAQAAAELAAAAAALAAGLVVFSLAMLAAFALWGLAIRHKALADDPPVPDFDYHERVTVSPQPYEFPSDDAPAWAEPLAATLMLIERVAATHQALTLIEPKILGARIDGAAEALRMQADDYRAALARLQAAAAELPNAAAVAAEQLAADARWGADALAAGLQAWRSGSGVGPAREAWRDAGLPEDAFRDMERRMPELTELTDLPLPAALVQLAGLAVAVADAVTQHSAEVLS
jgi:hypothetical protein